MALTTRENPRRNALQLCGLALLTLVTSACSVGHDFRGPGFDPTTGKVTADVPETVVFAVTSGAIGAGRSGDFYRELNAVMQDLTQRDGLVGYALRKRSDSIWTMSAWVDDASLDAFLAADPHRRAVREGGISRSSLRYARVPLPSASLPLRWEAAIALLPVEQP